MTAVFITGYRQRKLPKINEERGVQGQKNQIKYALFIFQTPCLSRPKTRW